MQSRFRQSLVTRRGKLSFSEDTSCGIPRAALSGRTPCDASFDAPVGRAKPKDFARGLPLGHTTRFFTIVINKRHRRSSDPPVTKSVPLPRWLPIESSPARPWRLPGGGERDRTDDLLLAKQALSQLSYTPRAKGGGSCAREGAARAARRRIELLSAPAPFGETACRPPGSVCCANAGGGPGRI